MKRTRLLTYILTVAIMIGLFQAQELPVRAASNLASLSNPSVGDYQDYGYTGGVQSFTAPVSGIYKLEAWGAQGGSGNRGGGSGGYAYGHKELRKGQTIYICVGAKGADDDGGPSYNGGGDGDDAGYSADGSGGGCTSITTVNRGVLSNFSSYRSEVLIVGAGGGGGARYSSKKKEAGGNGGGLTGEKGEGAASPGTQTGGGGSFGRGGNGYAGGGGSGGAGGGGGGWYGGGGGSSHEGRGKSGAGGSSYYGGCPVISYKGVSYGQGTVTGGRTGNGMARITFAVRTLSASTPAVVSYTEGDTYSITGTFSDAASYKFQIDAGSGFVDFYTSSGGLVTASLPSGFEDVTVTSSMSGGNGTVTVKGTVTELFDGKKLRVVATDSGGSSVTSDTLLQVTSVSRSHKTVVGQVGETADFSFNVHGAKSVALQVRAYGTDTWKTYVPAAGVVTNPITPTVRDGQVTFHYNSLTSDVLKCYYRIVLTNDGSGLISDEVFLTSCIYNLNYDDEAVETMMYGESEVLSVYYNAGTDSVLVYGYEQ